MLNKIRKRVLLVYKRDREKYMVIFPHKDRHIDNRSLINIV